MKYVMLKCCEQPNSESSDVVIIGGGIAGIVTAISLLDHGHRVAILERGGMSTFGGQAKEAFGGMWFVDTPIQRAHGVRDSKEIALQDWLSAAEFGSEEKWQRAWAEAYVNEGSSRVYEWLGGLGIKFLPAPAWTERGEYLPGNSLPRYHVMWGTSEKLVRILINKLIRHKNNANLVSYFYHDVVGFIREGERVVGCRAKVHGVERSFFAKKVVIASGGVTGNLDKVREYWPEDWPSPPGHMLNGSHKYSDGKVHDLAASELGAKVSGLGNFWNYPAGIHHPYAKNKDHLNGASVAPSRTAMWVDSSGKRIGPQPLVSGFDTRSLCLSVCQQKDDYTWHIMNWKIAKKEFNISGAIFNETIRDEKKIQFIKDIFTAPDNFFSKMAGLSEDIIIADDISGLVKNMNSLVGRYAINEDLLKSEIKKYDQQLSIKSNFVSDDQVRRLSSIRSWKADKMRICQGQRILDDNAGPLVAVRLHLITRKSLGGITTDLSSCVIGKNGERIKDLYAVGEASGFGGGGVNGKRSLEGTFLSLCIFNAMNASESIISELNIGGEYEKVTG